MGIGFFLFSFFLLFVGQVEAHKASRRASGSTCVCPPFYVWHVHPSLSGSVRCLVSIHFCTLVVWVGEPGQHAGSHLGRSLGVLNFGLAGPEPAGEVAIRSNCACANSPTFFFTYIALYDVCRSFGWGCRSWCVIVVLVSPSLVEIMFSLAGQRSGAENPRSGVRSDGVPKAKWPCSHCETEMQAL